MKVYLLNSKCVIILVLRWYNSNSNTTHAQTLSLSLSPSLSLSFSLLHARTHTRSLLSIKRVEIGTRPHDRTRLFGTRSTFRTLSAARHLYRAKIGTNRLSCTRPSKMQSRLRRFHYNLSTAVANHHHLHLLRAKTCTNHLSCTRLFGARSTLECRRRRRNRRTSVPTRAKICNSLLSCTRLVRTRSTSVYPRQTSLSSLVCTLHISSVCFPTLSRRKTLVRRT